MKKWTAVVLAFFALLCLNALSEGERIFDVSLSSDSVGQYELLEITFDTDADFVNPFDMYEIDIRAVFTTPSGEKITYPAFLRRPGRDLNNDFVIDRNGTVYDYNFDTGRFDFVRNEADIWCVRFSWNEIGTYGFSFEMTFNGVFSSHPGGTFTVTGSDQKGPIMKSKINPSYLVYRDSGEQFFAIGMNNAQNWDTFGYTRALEAIEKNGGNFARIWTGTDYGYNSLTIENWSYGPGMYNLDMAEAYDRVTRVAREKDIKLQVCFDSFSALSKDKNSYGQFDTSSIYNVKNGGFISVPSDFWTNEDCRKDYMNRVRYLMARSMWDTNIALWELMNEINGTYNMGDNKVQKAAAGWLSDMRDFILSVDPYDRPVGVSFHTGNSLDSWKKLAGNCNLDYIQVHQYSAYDVASAMKVLETNAHRYSDMAVIGEFGSMDNDRAKDPDWLYVHIGLWSGIHTGAFGTPMYWFHQELIEAGYDRYLSSVVNYVNAFDFVSEKTGTASIDRDDGIRAIGLVNQSGTSAIVYVYNAEYLWARKNPAAAENVSFTIKKLENIPVQVDIYNTFTGEIEKTYTETVGKDGKITVSFESLLQDAAVMVRPVSE